MKKWNVVLAAVFLSFLMAPLASAGAILDFGDGDGGDGGTIYFVGPGHIVGTGIIINRLNVNNTALDGTYTVNGPVDCNDASGCGYLNFDTSTNTISITGSISGLGLGETTLLSGSFASFSFITPVNGVGVLTATGPDVKDAALLEALGISPDALFNYFGFTIGFTEKDPEGVCGGDSNCYVATSTDIINSQVPEPSTLMLLGGSLVMLWARRRRG